MVDSFSVFASATSILLGLLVLPETVLAQSSAGTSTSPEDNRRTRVLIDSDANNELDDQHAIAYALLSGDEFVVEGITVNRTDNGGGIESQMKEAQRVVELVGLANEVPVIAGASGSYEQIAPSVDQDTFDGKSAVDFIIERAHADDDRPLVVIPIGKLTNVALALEKDPSIASEIRVVWLGSNFPRSGEYNLENDPSAVNPVLNSDAPVEVAVVRYGWSSGTSAIKTYQPEIKEVMPGLGPEVDAAVTGRHGREHTTFGDYSVSLFDHVDQYARALFDVGAVAVVKNPEWGKRVAVGPYRLSDGEWEKQEGRDDLVIWELFHTSMIIEDFFSTLQRPRPAHSQ